MRYVHVEEIIQLLTKYYSKLDIEVTEFMALNAYLHHSAVTHPSPQLDEIATMIGQKIENIKSILQGLANRQVIILSDGYQLDIRALYDRLLQIQKSEQSIAERILEDRSWLMQMGHEDHMGHVELVPMERGGIAVRGSHRPTDMWGLKDMEKLALEILMFTQSSTQKDVDEFNRKLEIQRERNRIEDEERRKQREEEKERAKAPKAGYLFIIRIFPSGYYKFTYTTDLLPQQKIANIQDQYGDHTEIVHMLELKDTLKFYHHFIKKQFSNRLVDLSHYELTPDDIQYLKNEEFPANAMDWMGA